MSARRSRLFTQHPIVAAALADLPPDRLAKAARGVAIVAARACGVLELCEDASDLDQLVANLDDVAWRTKDGEERSEGDAGSYDEAFRRARAADAWRQSAAGSSFEMASDAVYEALHALGGDAAAETRVVELLTA